MKREDIEEKARLIVDELNSDYYEVVDELHGEEQDAEPLYRKIDAIYACIEMAEWMQTQMMTESTHTDNREVIANLRAENEHLRNNVSNLIEELDASHVFCDGIQEKLNADFRKNLVDTIIYMSNRGIFNQLVKGKASNLDIAECVLQHLDTYAINKMDNKQ